MSYILTTLLGMNQVSTKWVSKRLNAHQKHECVTPSEVIFRHFDIDEEKKNWHPSREEKNICMAS